MSKFSKFSLRGLAAVASISVTSFFGGCYFERFKRKDLFFNVPFVLADNNEIISIPKSVESRMNEIQTRTSQIMKYGFPSLDQVRSFDDFVLSYDRRNRVANWVFEHLTPERLKVSENVNRYKCEFKEDTSIHPYFRATNNDYKGSGFDRGHLAAAGNHRLAQQHCDQTFYLSNISPQVGEGFNRHAWNRLEKYVRKLTQKYPNVYVCTGPLYVAKPDPDGKWYVKYQVIGVNQVAVPTHFFKVIVMESDKGDLHLESYVMPNEPIDDNTPLSTYLVPPEVVERYSGLLFFDRLSRKQLVAVNGKKTSRV